MSKSISVAEATNLAVALDCNVLEQWGFYSHFLRIRRNLITLNTINVRRDRVGRRAVVRACLTKLPVVHILAFDDTDQAECRSAEDHEGCTSNPTQVTCEHCLCHLDDIGRHPGP